MGAARAGRVSGVLELSRAGARRVLHLLEGDPIAFSSTVPGDGLASLLVQAAGLSADTARAWVDTEAPGVDVLDARVAAGDLSPEAAQATWRAWLTHGIQAPLEWSSGVWVFRREADLRAGCVDPALLPGVTALGTLRGSLDRLVEAEEALQEARNRTAPLHPGPRFEHLAQELGLPAAVARTIDEGGPAGPLVAGPDAVDMARLLWLLVRLRVVSSGGGPAPADLLVRLLEAGKGDPPPLAPRQPRPSRPARKRRRTRTRRTTPRTAPAPPATPAASRNAVETMLRVDRDTRLGRDHYRFLGVKEDESEERMQQAMGRLGKRWQDALEDARVDDGARDTARRLLEQLAQVRADLEDPGNRADYDARIGVVRSPFAIDTSADDPLLQTVAYEVEETR